MIIVSFIAPLSIIAQTTEIVRDNFEVESYSNNNGNKQWAGNWKEEQDDDKAKKGNVKIKNNNLEFNKLKKKQGIKRKVDLTGMYAARLIFEITGRNLEWNEEELDVQMSGDGTNFTKVATITSGSPSNFTIDISSYISSSTTVKFINTKDDWDEDTNANRFVKINYVEIQGDPAVCSLTDAGVCGVMCSDNGTPADASDDTFTFSLSPSGNNLGATYNVSGSFNQNGNPYGSDTSFGPFPISGGNLNLTITDTNDSGCQLTNVMIVAPTACSFSPSTSDDNYTASFEKTLTVNSSNGVLANDTDPQGNGTIAVAGTLVSGPSNGTVSMNANGSFAYTSNNGFVGTDSFTYKVCDDGSSINLISQFDFDTANLGCATYGPSASSVGINTEQAGCGIRATSSGSTIGLDVVVPNTDNVFNFSSFNIEFDYQDQEGEASIIKGGNFELYHITGDKLGIWAKVIDGSTGISTTYTSEIVAFSPGNNTYSVSYDEITGDVTYSVNGGAVNSFNLAPANSPLNVSLATQVNIGEKMDGGGSASPSLCRILIKDTSVYCETATVNITVKPIGIEIEKDNYAAIEDTTQGIQIILSESLQNPLTLDLSVTGGDATLGNDYTNTVTVTIPATTTSYVIPTTVFKVLDDSLIETNETIEFALTNLATGLLLSDVNTNATTQNTTIYTIQDNDRPKTVITNRRITHRVKKT